MINEQELFDPDPQDHPIQSSWATVGWPGDPDVVDLGSDANDGATLVKVTLKLGAPASKPRSAEGGFNGYKVVAQVGGPGWDVPPKGTRVLVVFPEGDIQTPGNGVIVSRAGVSPTRRFGRKKTVLDYAGKDLVITAKSIALVVEDSTGKRHVVTLSEEGGVQAISDGSGLTIFDGKFNLKTIDKDNKLRVALVGNQNEVSLTSNVNPLFPAAVTLDGGGAVVKGEFVTVDMSTAMKLGVSATPATPALGGLSGPAAVPAARIWIQVT